MSLPLTLIVAMGENRVIGRDNALCWHLRSDLKYFKAHTIGRPMIMGRKTFQSIGRPLPGRETLILSRHGFTAQGTSTITSVEALEQRVQDDPREVFVAGGAEIYSLLLSRCSDLFLTRVKRTVSGDAFFPNFESDFVPVATVMETPDFVVEHYQHRNRLLA